MRRRMMGESIQGFKPYYSNYPIFTEYGTYRLTPQTDDSTNTNTYVKLDDTSYNWRGGGGRNKALQVTYAENTFTANAILSNGEVGGIWFTIEQESKVARLKRCAGAENNAAEVEFYVEKVD